MTFEMEPTFTVAMRGYDRQQVDDYTATLRRMLDDAQRRAYAAAEAQAPTESANSNGNGTGGGATPAAPDARGASAYAGLGAHIEAMLRLAEQETADLRERGEGEAAQAVRRAEEEAEAIRRSATEDVEEVRERRATAQRESKAMLDTAREQAEDLLSRARRHAEDQAEGIVTQAEADARRVLDEARDTATARLAEAETRRQELGSAIEALTDRHRRIMEDLARVRAALDADPDIARQAAAGTAVQRNEIRLDDESVTP